MVSKTTYLTKQVKRAVEKYDRTEIVACSFTKAAAQELTGRLNIPDQQIGTLHALAYRELDRPDLTETREALEEWNEMYPMLRRHPTGGGAIDDLGSQEHKQANDGDEAMRIYQNHRAHMRDDSMIPRRARQFVYLWEEFKSDEMLMDFTDLIEESLESVKQPPGNPKVMLVDEAQDLTKLEMALVRKWASQVKTAVFCFDPLQSLYDFKGASPMACIEIVEDAEHKTTLSTSYRLPKSVKDHAESWIAQLKQEAPGEWMKREYDVKKNGEGKVDHHLASYKQPYPLIDDIKENPDRQRMVLTTCGYMLKPIIRELREHGVPFHNPYNRRRGKWNPLHHGGRTMRKRLLSFLKPKREDVFWDVREFRDWFSLLSSSEVLEHGAKRQVKQWEDEERNLKQQNVGDLFQDTISLAHAQGGDIDWLERNMLKSKKKAMEYPLRIVREFGVEALEEEPNVTVGTVHSVKGGESQDVYIFPDLSRAGKKAWNEANRASVLRTFYVGFTRTEENLYLCEPSTRTPVQW